MATATPSADGYNQYRLFMLTSNQGTRVVRKMLDQQINNVPLHIILAREKNTIKRLRKKTVTRDQYDLLFPKSGNPPTTADLGLCLAVDLMRYLNISALNPNFNWIAQPESEDMSLEADIKRLLTYRKALTHMPPTSMSDVEFNKKWHHIEQILLRLNSWLESPVQNLQQCIDDLKKGSLFNKKEQLKSRYDTEGRGGLLVLLNDEGNREGSDKDKHNVLVFFESTLGFEVMDMKESGDKDIHELLEAIKEKLRENTDKYYCIVFFIGCHGCETSITIKSKMIPFEFIKTQFNGKNLALYSGRPKIFLTQFCRGGGKEKKIFATDSSGAKAYMKGNENADILVAYSTADGKVSHRCKETGSVFVEQCCETLLRDWRQDHLEEMMITVRENVHTWDGYSMDEFENIESCFQTSVVESSLTKRLYFEQAGYYA